MLRVPGGSQYEYFSIRGESNIGTLEANYNLNEFILFFKPVVQHYEWEDLINQSAASTCEIFTESFGWDQCVNPKGSRTSANALCPLAKLAIQNITNLHWDFNCIVNGNSVHRLTINREMLEKFPSLPPGLSYYPVIVGMPKEAWFWMITRNRETREIFDGSNE